MSDVSRIDRRAFLASVAAAGGALTFGFRIPVGAPAHAAEAGPEITAWIVIEPDDTVVIRIAKSEMGQGVTTALSMLVAEELACDWSKVRPEFASAHENLVRNRIWGNMSTGGSRSIRDSQESLRQAGAIARTMLVAAAAKEWKVAPSTCSAGNGFITHAASGRRISYGKIAAAAARVPPPKTVKLKPLNKWRLAGHATKRLDVIDKVQGKPIYAIDVRLPDMLYAALIQCPVFKGTLKSVVDSKAARMRGVHKVVRLKDAVAVVAKSWWQAKKAADALSIVWDEGRFGKVSSATVRDFLRSGFSARDAGIGRRDGNVTEGLVQSVQRVEAEYEAPFLAHATLEPQNCTAHVVGDKVDIWVPTQNAEAALATAAHAAGVPLQNVRVHRTMLGGGFGRRGIVQDFIPHAVLIAKEIGRPVQTIWSREEDMRHDYYRPVAMTKMVAGLGADGLPLAWHVRMSGNSIRGTLTPLAVVNRVDKQFQEGFIEEMPYDVPNYLADYAMRNTHVPVGFFRCVNYTQNTFFKECFIDELAHIAKQDPYAYRRRMLNDHEQADRFLAVLDAAAKQANWDLPLPQGVGRGIAMECPYGTFVAGVIEASVDAKGRVRVHRVVCAVDCGHVVNPLTIEMQVESAVVFALTAALYGEITIKDGRVQQSNFNDYRMLRLAEMPKVETVLVPSGGFWSGVGEPPVAVVAPALCNAIFAATGKRIRSLPLKNHDLRKA